MITQLMPAMVKVADKDVHSPEFATLYVNQHIDFKPGQFVMVWIPGVDEKPYTISHHSPERFGITVEAKGLFSRKAVSLGPGDKIGIRGPFGNGFNMGIGHKRVAVVAGGCGMAPLAPLVETFQTDKGPEVFLIQGARSKSFLLYPDRFAAKAEICTDDGSKGYKGFVTDILVQKIKDLSAISTPAFDMVYACGPEIMMAKVFDICEVHSIPCQVSLERYMRCGFGVCGACVCGHAVVCKDGPVFGSKMLRTMADFNTRALLKTGQPVPLNEYATWRCQ
ncbi:dihydroorotate dehydrogenase electron transfer subunit [Desulfobacter hydrogenophilus]|uniref:Dihydroorotate dehydrogenase electron transfer subunit n=1 Tax=Desulfobacter hydrogenophilus TaxID=2291 RepID=A0A328FAP5_9BACT|nr:dihydroorotate dehydrogenase electron transfer subunit [Desulfobacter hydrogenophilus]NDY73432.1 dihydroorotate dehydrogenase electron transfer subunit [Desulfobacter hydrogenophilus]QBH12402.1 dihydroorotate dehydrogenase electron transfer subunit [Desulfobacter hydrogenophilus]RAM00760.1 dihydroorotate dehydrogenase electron transfer subunit [Desulfobacter hydrogenophilus]